MERDKKGPIMPGRVYVDSVLLKRGVTTEDINWARLISGSVAGLVDLCDESGHCPLKGLEVVQGGKGISSVLYVNGFPTEPGVTFGQFSPSEFELINGRWCKVKESKIKDIRY